MLPHPFTHCPRVTRGWVSVSTKGSENKEQALCLSVGEAMGEYVFCKNQWKEQFHIWINIVLKIHSTIEGSV